MESRCPRSRAPPRRCRDASPDLAQRPGADPDDPAEARLERAVGVPGVPIVIGVVARHEWCRYPPRVIGSPVGPRTTSRATPDKPSRSFPRASWRRSRTTPTAGRSPGPPASHALRVARDPPAWHGGNLVGTIAVQWNLGGIGCPRERWTRARGGPAATRQWHCTRRSWRSREVSALVDPQHRALDLDLEAELRFERCQIALRAHHLDSRMVGRDHLLSPSPKSTKPSVSRAASSAMGSSGCRSRRGAKQSSSETSSACRSASSTAFSAV